MATRKKTVKSTEEVPEENNEEVVTKELEVKEINPEVIPELKDLEVPVLRDEEPAEEDPKTFDDVYTLLEQIDGKIDVIIRGL